MTRAAGTGSRRRHAGGSLLTVGLAGMCIALSAPTPARADPPLGGWDRPGEESKKDGVVPPPGPPDPNAPRFEPREIGPDGPGTGRKRTIEEQRRAMAESRARAEALHLGGKLLFDLGALWRAMPSTLELGTLPGNAAPPAAESGAALGLQLGFAPVASLEVLGQVVWQPTRLRGISERATMVAFRGVLRALMRLGAFRPYLEVAGGGEWLSKGVGAIGADVDAALGFGFGSRIEFSPTVGMRVGAQLSATDGRGRDFAQIWEVGAALTVRFTPLR